MKKDLKPKPLYEELYDNLVFARKFYLSIIGLLMATLILITFMRNSDAEKYQMLVDHLEQEKAEALDKLDDCCEIKESKLADNEKAD